MSSNRVRCGVIALIGMGGPVPMTTELLTITLQPTSVVVSPLSFRNDV